MTAKNQLHMVCFALFASFAFIVVAAPQEQHYLYVALPGSDDADPDASVRILVFDIGNAHRFVRRIPLWAAGRGEDREAVRGTAATARTGRFYISTTKRLAAIDLKTDTIVWERSYEGHCCDRLAVSPDGQTIYAPAFGSAKWYVINAATGELRATIGVTTVSTVVGHNMIDHVAPYVRVEPGADAPIEAAYVAARVRREAQSTDLSNLSYDATPAMERVSHLSQAHLSGRLLGIALSVIATNPLRYLGSSLRQWPRFFLPPNYAYQFTGGPGAGLLHTLWKPERALLVLGQCVFLLLAGAQLACWALRRPGPLPPAAMILAGLVPVGLLVATFLAYGDTGRYGSVYVPVMVAVVLASAEPARARIAACRPILRRRPRPRGA